MEISQAQPTNAKKLLSVILLILMFVIFSYAQEKPSQRAVVRFPVLGEVEITAWEKDKDVPRLVFRTKSTSKLIREIKYSEMVDGIEWWKIDKSSAAKSPSIQFRILRFRQISGPVVFVTGAFYGGSDGTLETYLVAEVNGDLRVINTSPFISCYQGGTYVGHLGKRYGFGAVVWNFIWQDGFAHYASHPYSVTIYKFDPRTNEFKPARKLTTKRHYEYFSNPSGPLREFGIQGRDLLETLPGLRDRSTW